MLAAYSRDMSYAEVAKARRIRPVTIRNAIHTLQSEQGLETNQDLGVWAVRNSLLDG